MKQRIQLTAQLVFCFITLTLFACTPLAPPSEKSAEEPAKTISHEIATPPSLPVQYQKPSYFVDQPDKNTQNKEAEDDILKVGAKISSTKKIALRDIIKPLASQKKLNISWASDVNQDILVDVDIKAEDDFYKAIENLLRQVDYFYELNGSTLVIKYRETRQFHIAMPFTTQSFSTGTGGNFLGGSESTSAGDNGNGKNVEGTIKLTSDENKFDNWENIKLNLDSILEIWTYRREGETVKKETGELKDAEAKAGSRSFAKGVTAESKDALDSKSGNSEDKEKSASQTNQGQISGGKGFYIIDKPVGLITVTAPRPLIEKVEAYITSLQKEIYKQITIEAKIIEVQLLDSSSIGINWDSVLKNFNLTGAIAFGSNTAINSTASSALGTVAGAATGTVAQTVRTVTNPDGSVTTKTMDSSNNLTNSGSINSTTTSTSALMGMGQVWPDVSKFVSSIKINTADFNVLLNALKTQGNTKVLSNPKISVMNGQPALISVGRNVTYLKKVTSEVSGSGADRTIQYSADPGTILSGVGLGLTATVLNNNEIVMDLIPVTSELVEGTEKAQVVAGQGETEIKMGLPVVNVREMSTTVRVHDGELLVIGGLISDMEDNQGNFAPVVGDIPLVKYLFGHEEKIKQKRELLILLKPHLL